MYFNNIGSLVGNGLSCGHYKCLVVAIKSMFMPPKIHVLKPDVHGGDYLEVEHLKGN